MCAGSVNRSSVVNAIDFAATIIPFTPIVPPAQAVACQLCAGTPGANVAAVNDTVGTFQLTSAKSVDELLTAPDRIGRTCSCDPTATSGGSVNVFRISSANFTSSGVYEKPPTRSRFLVITPLR